MRADICDPSDESAVKRFRQALKKLGADLSSKDLDCGTGVDVYRLRIQGQELTVFSDNWSIDIEGPESVVQVVVDALTRD
jgi:hypothetical protein